MDVIATLIEQDQENLADACFGVAELVADGFEFHIQSGNIYFAMAFAAAMEACNVMARHTRQRRWRR